ncbi:MAG: nuclear transport factor 2 family protein [Pseudomonadota bacterium]
MNLAGLSASIARIEATEAIRQLKARYFFYCDQKDPDGMRACFAEGEVAIDYGAVGRFTNRDTLVDVFMQLGCHEHIVDMHHGVNPDITIVDAENARGIWGLHFQQIDTQKQTVTQLGAYYNDEYRKIDGAWKISATRCTVTSTMVSSIADGQPRIIFAGRAPGG